MNPLIIRKVAIGEGRPKICVPIVAQTAQEAAAQAGEIRSLPCDLVEWRADWFSEAFGAGRAAKFSSGAACSIAQTARLLRETLGEIPLLFTFRTGKEGGERMIAKEDYELLNLFAAAGGLADLVDIELLTVGGSLPSLMQALHTDGVKVILSSHNFQETPSREELLRLMNEMRERGADAAKVAVMPQSEEDVLTLLAATAEMRRQHPDIPLITMAMGKLGAVSRVAGETFGSAVTFGAAGKASAPGQPNAEKLAQLLDIMHSIVS